MISDSWLGKTLVYIYFNVEVQLFNVTQLSHFEYHSKMSSEKSYKTLAYIKSDVLIFYFGKLELSTVW